MKLRLLRKQKNMTQKQLEEASGIQFQHISRLERGERKIGGISLSVAARLAKALGVHAEELLDDDEKSAED